MRKHLLFTLILGVILFMTSCMSSTSLQILKPAEINIPTHIEKLAVINRSVAGEGEKFKNVVEGIFTGEGIGTDKQASDNAVNGLVSELVSSPRFTIVAPKDYQLTGTGTSRWPLPLEWSLVSEICERHKVDALVTIETFDSDQNIRVREVTRKRKEDDKTIEYVEYQARMDVRVDAGWRIYYPKSRRIIDENIYRDNKYFDAVGETAKNARSRLVSNRRAVNDAGYFSGVRYAFRISPLWINVTRSYYSKGNDDLKLSKRLVRSNQWEEARKIWERNVEYSDPKIAGRAMYNIALSYEVEGDLESALQWANESYVATGKGQVQAYINTLRRRQFDEERLEQQMENR